MMECKGHEFRVLVIAKNKVWAVFYCIHCLYQRTERVKALYQ